MGLEEEKRKQGKNKTDVQGFGLFLYQCSDYLKMSQRCLVLTILLGDYFNYSDIKIDLVN